ncbi:MAG TPA: 1,4-alpha-glucan branching protein domain-containing protein [Solirubrobacteraceae bacterium]|nr:1,4-alpha-glucan branching protein domain-containing protein [Solirubrobacteraceae bacterium]
MRPEPAGELALVLHTHMPYVEGFGTWPFGEEWLFEAMAGSYLPLLDVLDRADGALTLSLTPVLADQLQSARLAERFRAFVEEVREDSHARDIAGLREGGHEVLAAELERSREDYRAATARLDAAGGDLLAALAPHVAWTSAATHAVLPLLATDAGARLQVQLGVDSHHARFGGDYGRPWRGGFWLPECAHAPWLDPLLEEAGVHATCVDLTDVLGPGSRAHLRPLRSPDGPVLAPIARDVVELVWSDSGYPAHAAYRDYHHHTVHHHRPWDNGGRAYDRELAAATAREHAADFVARVRERVAGGGLCVCALDTELLGHWWHEGPVWLSAVLDEAARQGLALTGLDDALERHEAVPVADALAGVEPSGPAALAGAERAGPAAVPSELPVTTWGTPRDLSTWSGPRVADLAWRARAAELRVLRAGRDAGPRALRELLALQSSDWTFMVTRELAGPYPRGRADAHAVALDDALRLGSHAEPALRDLAPALSASALPEP